MTVAPCRFDRPLRIAALVKQIPVGESMALGDDGRLVREGLELEMNAYCRRAVSKGVEWAGQRWHLHRLHARA
jgi:electron transfer flavoprotein alpha/beta subunit